MKMMKLTYLLAFALAVTLADTGCKNHRPTKVMQIPTRSPTGNPIDLTDINTKPYNSNEPIGVANRDEFKGMIKDPAALAAYTADFAYARAAVRPNAKSTAPIRA